MEPISTLTLIAITKFVSGVVGKVTSGGGSKSSAQPPTDQLATGAGLLSQGVLETLGIVLATRHADAKKVHKNRLNNGDIDLVIRYTIIALVDDFAKTSAEEPKSTNGKRFSKTITSRFKRAFGKHFAERAKASNHPSDHPGHSVFLSSASTPEIFQRGREGIQQEFGSIEDWQSLTNGFVYDESKSRLPSWLRHLFHRFFPMTRAAKEAHFADLLAKHLHDKFPVAFMYMLRSNPEAMNGMLLYLQADGQKILTKIDTGLTQAIKILVGSPRLHQFEVEASFIAVEAANAKFHFYSDEVDFVGRTEIETELDRFLAEHPESPLRWVQINGRAGAGKSKLALRFCQRYSTPDPSQTPRWLAGFYKPTSDVNWNLWRPIHDTIMVVEGGRYARFKVGDQNLTLVGLIDHLNLRASSEEWEFKLRIVATDRHGTILQTFTGQDEGDQSDRIARVRALGHRGDTVQPYIQIPDLSEQELESLLDELQAEPGDLLSSGQKLQPLDVLLAVQSRAKRPTALQPATSAANQSDYTGTFLKDEREKWKGRTSSLELDLLFAACIVGEIDPRELDLAVEAFEESVGTENDFADLTKLNFSDYRDDRLDPLLGLTARPDKVLTSIVPGILAERFVLDRWDETVLCDGQDHPNKISRARHAAGVFLALMQSAPEKTIHFLFRLQTSFGSSEVFQTVLDLPGVRSLVESREEVVQELGYSASQFGTSVRFWNWIDPQQLNPSWRASSALGELERARIQYFMDPSPPSLTRLASALFDAASFSVSKTEADRYLSDLRVLYKTHTDDPNVREWLASGLNNAIILCTQEDQVRIDNLLHELRDLYKTHADDPNGRECLAKGLFNAINRCTQEDQARIDNLLHELRVLYKTHTDDPNVREWLASGLNNAIILCTQEDQVRIDNLLHELRDLYKTHADDPNVRELLAAGLYNTINRCTQEDQARIDNRLHELRVLYKTHADDPNVRECLASGLNTAIALCTHEDQVRIDNRLHELRVLYKTHADDPNVREWLAKGLNTAIALCTHEDQVRIDNLLHELRVLYKTHADDPNVREWLASGLFNAINRCTQEDQVRIDNLLHELRVLYKTHADDPNGRECLAKGLFNAIILCTQEDQARIDNLLHELRVLYKTHADNPNVRELLAKGLVNALYRIKHEPWLEELVQLESPLHDPYISAQLAIAHYNRIVEVENMGGGLTWRPLLVQALRRSEGHADERIYRWVLNKGFLPEDLKADFIAGKIPIQRPESDVKDIRILRTSVIRLP